MPLESNDSFAANRFALEIDGEILAFFQDVSGISSEVEPIVSYQSTPDGKSVLRKTPGKRKDADITLKRGKSEDRKLWDWMQQVQEGKLADARKTGSVVLYGYDGEELLRVNFDAAWPSRVALGAMSAKSSEVVIEECTIVHEGVTLDGGG